MDDDSAQKMAMFRFGLIAPALNGTYSQKSRQAYYRDVTAAPLTLPDGTKAGYAVSTLVYWEGLYRKGGFDALVGKGRSDKGHFRKLSAEARDSIVALRREFPKINATIIYERLIAQGVIDACEASLSTVQRFVRARCTGTLEATDTKDRRAFEAERVCGIWQADTLYGVYVPTDRGKRARTYLTMVIDDKSRLIVGARFFLSDNAQTFQCVLKDAIIRFGIPERLFVDNGSPYRNDQLTGICGRLGIVLIHAAVADGAAKGKIERANRTCRSRFLAVLTEEQTSSLEALNDALICWVNTYNTTVHSAHGTTPMKAYRKGIDEVRQPKSAEWVSECFLNRITRKVRQDATISIGRISYDVPMGLVNTRVEVRHAPADMSGAHIVSDGAIYPCRPTDYVANSKIPRKGSRYRLEYREERDDGIPSAALPA
jgi:transposase InsO family protein